MLQSNDNESIILHDYSYWFKYTSQKHVKKSAPCK